MMNGWIEAWTVPSATSFNQIRPKEKKIKPKQKLWVLWNSRNKTGKGELEIVGDNYVSGQRLNNRRAVDQAVLFTSLKFNEIA